MGVLKVRTGDTWEDVSGVTTNEVYVGPDDPRQGLYKNALFWWDTEANVLKVWDGQAKSWLVATDTTDFLPLTGGTLTGNLTFSGTNLGVNFSGGSGVYAHTDKPLTLREGTSGAQPQIRNSDGSTARDIIDTTNGDARYAQRQQHYGATVPGPYTQTKMTINVTVAGRYLVQWGGSYMPNSGADWWTVNFYVDNVSADTSTAYLSGTHSYAGTRIFERDFTAGNHTFGISGQVTGDEHDSLTVLLIPTT